MHLNENEIRKIIRKNILQSFLIEGGVTDDNLIYANRINIPTNMGDGKGQAIIAKDDNDKFQFLVPDDESIGILYRAQSTDSWSKASSSDSAVIKTFIAKSEQKAISAFDVANNPITPEMSNLIGLSAENLFKEAALGQSAASGGIFTVLKTEFASTWEDINRYRISAKMPPIGFIIEAAGIYQSKDVNILREPPQGKGDYTTISDKIFATTDTRVFSLDPKWNFDLDKDQAKKIFESQCCEPSRRHYTTKRN